MTVLLALLALGSPAAGQLTFSPPPEVERAHKPVPLSPPPSWVTERDYPKAARGSGAQGRTSFRLNVDAQGRIMSCVITGSSGYKLLDDQTCLMIRRRGGFRPARDGKGNPIPFTWNSWFQWELPH